MSQFILIMLLVATSPTTAPASTQCAAKPFLLHKPVPQHAPQAANADQPAPKPKTEVAKAAKPKAKPIADCDKPKKS